MNESSSMTSDSLQLTVNRIRLSLCQASSVKCQVSWQRGQSLLEVVISVAIAAILAIALVTTTLITQRTSQSAKNNTEAAKLVQEEIEQIRVFRDRNGYDALVNGNCFIVDTTTSMGEIEWHLYSASCPELKQLDKIAFYRKLSIEDVSSDPTRNTKLVRVEVSWDDPKGAQSVESETILSRWQQF